MRTSSGNAEKLRSVFAKVAEGRLTPNNFGSSLLAAVKDGVCSKDYLAAVLDVEPRRFRQAGNSMKPKEMVRVAKALLEKQ